MKDISSNVQKELDALIKIAKEFRDGTISSSMFYDVAHSLAADTNDYDTFKEYLDYHNISIGLYQDEIEDSDNNDDVNNGDYVRPYDPTNIDISLRVMSLQLIIDRLEADEIDLMPDFQRRAGLWSEKQKSQLIESLILRIPLPAFYFDGSFNDRWIVIDGLQRLTALKQFFVERRLKLTGLEFLGDLEGTTLEDIPRAYIRRMRETQITAYIINPGAPMNLKYNIFKRINTGGLNLEPQEIRHALYQGTATKFIKELAELEVFKQATGYSINVDRMLDREFVLRFLAFYEFGYQKYKGSIDPFLNDAMDYVNKYYFDEYMIKMKELFVKVLNVSMEMFGKFSFRKMPDFDRRRSISKALFETWTSTLAKMSANEHLALLNNKDYLLSEYVKLFNSDKDFNGALNSGKISSVKMRFEKIDDLIRGVLLNDRKN